MKYTFFFNDASYMIGYVKFELHINAKVSFPFNGIDPAVCRSTAAYIFIGVRAGGPTQLRKLCDVSGKSS